MSFNRNAIYFFLFLCVVLSPKSKYQVQAKTGTPEEPVCGSGTFLTKYFDDFGTCAGCPESWTDCTKEAAKDVKPCEEACGKLSSTLSPSFTNATIQNESKPTMVTLKATSDTTRQVTIPTIQTFKTTFFAGIVEQKTAAKRESSSSNDGKIWICVLAGVLAVLAIVLGLLLRWRRRRVKSETVRDTDEEVNTGRGPYLNRSPSSSSVSMLESVQETGYTYSSNMNLKETHL